MENNISIKNEFLRKSIHLSNSGIAFLLRPTTCHGRVGSRPHGFAIHGAWISVDS